MSQITITSSTDNPDSVRRALGQKVDGKPAAKAAAAPAEAADGDDDGNSTVAAEPEHVESGTTRIDAVGDHEEVTGDLEEGSSEAGDDDGDGETVEQPRARANRRGNDPEKRIGRLTWENNNLLNQLDQERQSREALSKRLEALERGERPGEEAAAEPAAKAKPVYEVPEPDLDKADTIEAWMKDYAKWASDKAAFEARQVAEETLETRGKENEEAAARKRGEDLQTQVVQQHMQRLNKFQTQYDDFDEVAAQAKEDQVPVSQIALIHIQQSDLGPALLYHLAKNPEEAVRLNQLPAGKQIAALGRLEEKLENRGFKPIVIGEGGERSPATAPRPRSATRTAPPAPTVPVKPVGGGGGGATKNPSKMSMHEYKQWRQKGGGKR